MSAVNTFSWALAELKNGATVTRDGWNGKGQYIELQKTDEHSKMSLPYLFITTVQGDRVPWVASQTDLLASDWQYAIPVIAGDAEDAAVSTAHDESD